MLMPDIAGKSLDVLRPGVLDVARAAGRAISGVYTRTDLGVDGCSDQE